MRKDPEPNDSHPAMRPSRKRNACPNFAFRYLVHGPSWDRLLMSAGLNASTSFLTTNSQTAGMSKKGT
jgi:hypothetical protein